MASPQEANADAGCYSENRGQISAPPTPTTGSCSSEHLHYTVQPHIFYHNFGKAEGFGARVGDFPLL